MSVMPREETRSERWVQSKSTQRLGGLLTITGNPDIKGKLSIAHLCNPYRKVSVREETLSKIAMRVS